MHDLMTDTVFVESQLDGSRRGPFKASLSPRQLVVFDPEFDIEDGDIVCRPLPKGREERYTALEASYSEAFHGIEAHWSVAVQKVTAIPRAGGGKTTTVHIHGSSGIQVGDHNLMSFQNAVNEMIEKIDVATASEAEKAEAKSLLQKFLKHPLVTSIAGGIAGSAML